MKRVCRAAQTVVLENRILFGVSRTAYRLVKRAYYAACVLLDRKRVPYYDLYLHVAPGSVAKKSRIESRKFVDIGKVRSGDWDLDVVGFQEDYPYYSSLRSVLMHGGRWEDTALYQDGLEKIASAQTAWGCRDVDGLRKRVDHITRLFESIRDHGYKCPENRRFTGFSDEVSVHIGRGGDLLFEDGGHRLVIAQLLGLPSIPVQVTLRHAIWDEIRRRALPGGAGLRADESRWCAHPDIASVREYLDGVSLPAKRS